MSGRFLPARWNPGIPWAVPSETYAPVIELLGVQCPRYYQSMHSKQEPNEAQQNSEEPLALEPKQPKVKPPSRIERLLTPAIVLLKELNPNVNEIEDKLSDAGVPNVVAWALQKRVEGRVRSQKRKAETLLAEYKACGGQEQKRSPYIAGPYQNNRAMRRSLFAVQARKRRGMLRQAKAER